jgi:hypothetical protein
VRSGRIIWDNFQANQTSIASRADFPVICSSCREHLGFHATDLYMHVASILFDLLYTGISCCFTLYSSDDQLL